MGTNRLWLTTLNDEFRGRSELISNGFKEAGIAAALANQDKSAEISEEDPFVDLDYHGWQLFATTACNNAMVQVYQNSPKLYYVSLSFLLVYKHVLKIVYK